MPRAPIAELIFLWVYLIFIGRKGGQGMLVGSAFTVLDSQSSFNVDSKKKPWFEMIFSVPLTPCEHWIRARVQNRWYKFFKLYYMRQVVGLYAFFLNTSQADIQSGNESEKKMEWLERQSWLRIMHTPYTFNGRVGGTETRKLLGSVVNFERLVIDSSTLTQITSKLIHSIFIALVPMVYLRWREILYHS